MKTIKYNNKQIKVTKESLPSLISYLEQDMTTGVVIIYSRYGYLCQLEAKRESHKLISDSLSEYGLTIEDVYALL
ncbi:hypothetical protein VOWphi5012_073 [Vibrio phage phi50-12]|uniref:Uncharacterized protein n=1 Tax=Vibrio phage phi50-12 TaxID=2654972 RepID=A0A5P8PRD8_9CAUD|nr:hypothetical protein KNU82_gp073 [Vibrio phage phi50-12]QFR59857.1 hypothetical protein VOWphi5012_073 [Vibrio phage phi50-12]